MTKGFDLSRYDDEGPDGSDAVADPWADYVRLNVEDPRFANKVARARGEGKPWGPYSWLYGDRGGAEAVDRMMGAVDSVSGRYGLPDIGGWVDYEANGVAPVHATQARVRSQVTPWPVGLYTYLYLLNSQDGLAAEWWQWVLRWVAYYPGTNDGSYPAGAIGDAQAWGSIDWQFSSSNGQRDRNQVVDEAAWARLAGAATEEDDDVKAVYISKKSDPNLGIWVTDGMHKRHVLPDEWQFVQFVSGGQAQVVGLSDQWWDSIPTASPDTSLTLRDLANVQSVVESLGTIGGGSGGPVTVPNLTVTLTGTARPV